MSTAAVEINGKETQKQILSYNEADNEAALNSRRRTNGNLSNPISPKPDSLNTSINQAAEAVKAAAVAQSSQGQSHGSSHGSVAQNGIVNSNSGQNSTKPHQTLSFKQKQIQNTDCTYYLIGNCMRGKPACYYRHCPGTLNKTAEDVCKVWISAGMCSNPECELRHPRPQHVGPGKYNLNKLANGQEVAGYATTSLTGAPAAVVNATAAAMATQNAQLAAAQVAAANAGKQANGNKFSWKAGQTTLIKGALDEASATQTNPLQSLGLTGALYKNPISINEQLLTQNKISLNGSAVNLDSRSLTQQVNDELLKDERSILLAENSGPGSNSGEDQDEVIRKVQAQISQIEADKKEVGRGKLNDEIRNGFK